MPVFLTPACHGALIPKRCLDFAHYLDEVTEGDSRYMQHYGGKSLHAQSHGESFLALFNNKFRGQGSYILDEPEAALSPRRQLQFVKVMRMLELEGQSQMIIATHSPILMADPRSQLLMFDGRVIREALALFRMVGFDPERSSQNGSYAVPIFPVK